MLRTAIHKSKRCKRHSQALTKTQQQKSYDRKGKRRGRKCRKNVGNIRNDVQMFATYTKHFEYVYRPNASFCSSNSKKYFDTKVYHWYGFVWFFLKKTWNNNQKTSIHVKYFRIVMNTILFATFFANLAGKTWPQS